MAFGDALRGNTADVVLTAETGQFNAEIDQAERNWRESINSMSKEALKLDLAQDRLRTSLAKYGSESTQAKRATIALKDAEEQVARAADRATREYDQQQRSLSRMSRGALAGSGAFRNLGRSLAFASAGFLGGAGFVYAIRSAISAAQEAENVLGQTRIAVDAAGLSWEGYEDQIQAVIRAQSQLGFDDENLMRTFQMFVRSTKNVNEALRLNALAMGVARGRYIELDQAAQIVNKANLGMSGALRRVGIDVEKNADRVKLLALLTENYGSAAEGAADDSITATQRLSVEWENLQEIIGSGLLPAVTDLSNRLSDYMGDAENQRRLQQRVNEAVETGEEVIRGLAGGLRVVKRAIDPFVDAVGGAENAVKLLVIALAVGKVLSFARAIGLIGTNARFAATQMGALTAASAGAGRGGVPLPLGVNPLAAIATLGIVGYYGATNAESGPKFEQLIQAAYAGQLTMEQAGRLRKFLKPGQYEQLVAAIRYSRGGGGPEIVAPGEGRLGGPGTPAASGSGGGGGGGGGGPSESDLELNLARAQASGGSGAPELRALRSFYARQIKALEARKNLTEKQKEKLRGLYGSIASVQSQLDAIADEEERKAADKRRQREEKRRREREREEARMEKILDSAMEAAERRGRLLRGTGGNRANMRRAALAGVDETLKGLKKKTDGERPLTKADLINFITGLQGATNQFGGNLGDANTWVIANLTREQNAKLDRLTRGVQHPGAKYARTEMALALGGVGAI